MNQKITKHPIDGQKPSTELFPMYIIDMATGSVEKCQAKPGCLYAWENGKIKKITEGNEENAGNSRIPG